MTDSVSLTGTIENGRRGNAAFPFYTGPVGIRDRGDFLEVAFFASPMRLKALPLEGTLDGRKVRVTAIRARSLNEDAPAKTGSNAARAIIAIVEAIPSAED